MEGFILTLNLPFIWWIKEQYDIILSIISDVIFKLSPFIILMHYHIFYFKLNLKSLKNHYQILTLLELYKIAPVWAKCISPAAAGVIVPNIAKIEPNIFVEVPIL